MSNKEKIEDESPGVQEQLRGRISELEADLAGKTDRIRALENTTRPDIQLLALLSDAILLTRRKKIIFANSAAVRLHGAESPEQLIGMKILELIHPDDRDVTRSRISALEAGNTLAPFTQKRVRLDGSMFWAETHTSYIPWGGERAIVVIVHDLTQEKEAARALKESEEKLRKVFEATGVGITIRNTANRIIEANAVMSNLLGYSLKKLESLHFDDITHPDDAAESAGYRTQLMAGEIESYQIRKRFIHKNGNLVWVLNNTSVVRDEQGEASFFISIFQDITQQRQVEEQLRQAQKMDSLGTLAGGVAHELNNMLFPICGMTEMALNEVEEGSLIHNNLSVVLKSAERASELVEKILSFSHQDTAERKPVVLVDVIEEELELLRTTLPSTIDIKTDLDSCMSTVLADEIQIHQILMNLASNAAHAMRGHTGKLTIGLSKADLGDETASARLGLDPGAYAILSIGDTGHGMDQQTVERIFDPFFTTKEVGMGTGMGLSIIHGIIASHGGAIDVASLPGEGTTFTIYLPLVEECAMGKTVNG